MLISWLCCFGFLAVGMQQRLGVAAGLHASFKDKITRRLEGGTVSKAWAHIDIGWVTGILHIYHCSHLAQKVILHLMEILTM